MAKKKQNWEPTCKRFVAFLDIMGFKDMVFRNEHQEVYDMFESLRPAINTIQLIAKFASKSKKGGIVKPIIFSDSIILISNDISQNAYEWMIFDIQWIIRNAIEKGIPIKGAISCGLQTAEFRKSLFFGKPLIEAYELQKELQLYGVVLHHTIEKRLIDLESLKKIDNDYIICKYPVPTKSGKITHYILDWTIFCKYWKEDALILVNLLYNNVSGTPRVYVDNTLEFVKWSMAYQAELPLKNADRPVRN